MIVLTIPGPPFSQKRHRVDMRGGFARAHDDKRNISWKGSAQVHMLRAMGDRQPFDEPIRVTIVAGFEMPKGRCLKRSLRPAEWNQSQKDVDNIAKAVLDAGNGIIYVDDRRVAELLVQKVTLEQGVAPSVRVTVEALGEMTVVS